MIYLIGGPPKCWKTTLAKKLSKETWIPWVSTDTLQDVIKPYIPESDYTKLFPVNYQKGKSNDDKYSKYTLEDIKGAYITQSKTVYKAVDMFVICEITDGNDYIIEGYHITPELAEVLSSKYPDKIRSVFIVKTDVEKFIRNIKNSSTPNDWIIAKTLNDETYRKIADMICEYGKYFIEESDRHGQMVLNIDEGFEIKIKEAIKILLK
ncbi:MAG: hypothetical protein ACD_3C00232G0003 [uncultured bacterium (gcode 4)]|uniref:Uncharacterized protein n=1 Tax=uncultured bacterium (gcode 4) TaxID=1234023 RepID=K2FZA6_9BACT|nr:MAG: hypothetical protein ACD_3C00232G0003 [uncultured bacterium (gcode 4)]